MNYNDTNFQAPNPQQDDITRGKTVGILSYCTILGWIVAIILHQQDKTKFGAFHLRQGLGIFLAYLICFAAVMITSPIFGFFTLTLIPILGLAVLIFAIIGLVNAINGQQKEIPLLGGLSEKVLAGIK